MCKINGEKNGQINRWYWDNYLAIWGKGKNVPAL